MAHKPRQLTESFTASGPHVVDREAGVIRRVRILGHESRNTHGASGVEATEYPKSAHDSARGLYENALCFVNHKGPKEKRGLSEAFGRFRNVTVEVKDGHPATYGDLHYLKSHDDAARVCEDAERSDSLGMFGMSHDAYAGKERIDRNRKRLVIESLARVNSVDIVLGAATNRNLWESQEPTMKSLKSLLETAELPAGKKKWVRKLIEDTELRNVIESEGETIGDGFTSAIEAIITDPAIPAAGKSARIARLLETQERLESSTDSEPEAETLKDETPELARVLAENAELKAAIAVRQLCESEGFTPKPHQLKSIQLLESETERKALIADLKASVKPAEQPRSGFRRMQETTTPVRDAKAFMAKIRN